jgi:hypothetical protein
MNREPNKLLQQMGRLVVPVLSPEREAELHARTTAAVDRTLDRLVERRSVWRGRVGGALGAAAAIAVVALASAWFLPSQRMAALALPRVMASTEGVSVVKRSGERLAVSDGVALSRGDELRTAAGARANLSLADHAAMDVAPDTQVRVAEPPEGDSRNERLELSQGEVSFRVPKLEVGSTLSVRTPDSLVTVRGTRFTVNVERSSASVVTRVSVSDGRVEVESHGRTQFLTRGERWSSASETEVAQEHPVVAESPQSTSDAQGQSRAAPERAAQAATSASEAAPERSRLTTSAPSPREQRRSPETPSTLRDENRLYQDALRLARNGDAARSLTTLDSLMQQYPRSPLVQSARVEYFRTLLQTGNVSAAARQARRYLSDYPSGFARAEARQIALRGLGDAE